MTDDNRTARLAVDGEIVATVGVNRDPDELEAAATAAFLRAVADEVEAAAVDRPIGEVLDEATHALGVDGETTATLPGS